MKSLLLIPTSLWFAFSMVCYFFAEYLSKLWGNSPSWKLALLVNLAYTVSTVGWLAIMAQKRQLVLMSTFWYLMGGIVTILVGTLIFREQLTPLHWLGVSTTMLSLLLLST